MKKRSFTYLLLLMAVHASMGQCIPVPGQNTTITIQGDTYKLFVPNDYATHSGYYFHIAFTGDKQINNQDAGHEQSGKWLQKDNITWNGRVVMNNGDTARFIVLTIPDYGYQPKKYSDAIDTVMKVLGKKTDTTRHHRFSASGIGGGAGRLWGYLTGQGGAASPYPAIFLHTITVSPTFPGVDITARSSRGRHWIWYAASDPDPATPPAAAKALYNVIKGDKRITSQAASCHCSVI